VLLAFKTGGAALEGTSSVGAAIVAGPLVAGRRRVSVEAIGAGAALADGIVPPETWVAVGGTASVGPP